MTTTPKSSPVIESLTAAEMSIAERASNLSIATLEDPEYPKIDLLAALGWVHAKRSEPTLTYLAYKDSRTLKQITEQLEIEEDDESEDSVESGKGSSSSGSKPRGKRSSS